MNNLQVTSRTATSLTITWTVSGFIDQFEVTYSYTVKECSAPESAPHTDNISRSDISMMSHTLRDLNEDSRYTITVRAINIAGTTMLTTSMAETGKSGKKLTMLLCRGVTRNNLGGRRQMLFSSQSGSRWVGLEVQSTEFKLRKL